MITPHNYQYDIVWSMLEMDRGGFINAGFGLGKTISILMFCVYKYKTYGERSMICIPASTFPNYKIDLEKLGFDVRLFGFTDKPKIRAQEFTKPIVIISYEILGKIAFYGENIILDECTMVKNPESLRFKELMRIKNLNKSNLRFYGLSGALSTVEIKYFYTYFKLINEPSLRSVNDFHFYLRLFFDQYTLKTIYVNNKKVNIYEYSVKNEYKDKLIKDMGRYIKNYDRNKYNDLPEHKSISWYSDKNLEKSDVYLIRNRYAECEKANLVVLQEISSGFKYDKETDTIEDHGYKKLKFCISKLERLVKDNNEHILVFYNFKEEYKYLKKHLESKGIIAKEARAKDAVTDWNKGRVDVLLCHPMSGGRGLNLQAGGSIYMWVTLPLSLELYQQAAARLHRQGQKKAVTEIVVLFSDVDVYVYNLLTKKDYVSAQLLEKFQ